MAYLDESCLIYPTGNSLVLYQPDAQVQRQLAGGPEARATAFAACPAKRLLALAERGSERSTITVFDAQTLKRRKVLAPPADAAKVCGKQCFRLNVRQPVPCLMLQR